MTQRLPKLTITDTDEAGEPVILLARSDLTAPVAIRGARAVKMRREIVAILDGVAEIARRDG